mmetsp:Transcript_57171/g.165845  ORF Transcript_57171/g.165845 Transcript_57171/m.165845 type:complete len:219 (-) Transcript_57171:630-1286(-)
MVQNEPQLTLALSARAPKASRSTVQTASCVASFKLFWSTFLFMPNNNALSGLSLQRATNCCRDIISPSLAAKVRSPGRIPICKPEAAAFLNKPSHHIFSASDIRMPNSFSSASAYCINSVKVMSPSSPPISRAIPLTMPVTTSSKANSLSRRRKPKSTIAPRMPRMPSSASATLTHPSASAWHWSNISRKRSSSNGANPSCSLAAAPASAAKPSSLLT